MSEITPRIAVIIPARGGSKGVPGKNIRPLAGKPLIQHSVEQAKAAKQVMQVYVSTDDRDIARFAVEAGAEVIQRPANLAADTSGSEVALQHALEVTALQGKHYDYWVFLQCTSPFRHEADIDQAIDTLIAHNADSLLSVVDSHRFLWTQSDTDEIASVNYDYKQRPRRQDMPLQYQENGSIYIYKPWVLTEYNNRLGGKIALYVMQPDSAVDIDTLWDFRLAEALMRMHEE